MSTLVFISYSSEDEQAARAVCKAFEGARIGCWAAYRDIPAGTSWDEAIARALSADETQLVVLLYTANASGSKDVLNEVVVAGQQQKPIIPVRLDDIPLRGAFQYHLARAQWLDAFPPPLDGHLPKLVEEARKIVRAPDALASVHPLEQRQIWKIRSKNPNFTGRSRVLDELEARLEDPQNGANVVAIVGPPGFGKTQLAVEYAYRHRRSYSLACSVSAEERATLLAGFARLAGDLGLAEREDQEATAEAVRTALEEESEPWLLILDNAESATDLDRVLPQSGLGDILITSRYRGWRAVGASLVEVDAMTLAEATDFLLTRTGQKDREGAEVMAQELLGYPLALEQAAAYVDQTGMGFARYVGLLRERGADLLARGIPSGYDRTFAATWELAIAEIERESKEAVELLRLCAHLGADNIPIAALNQSRANGDAGAEWPRILRDELALEDALSVLARYSHLRRTEDPSLAIHRTVQRLARERLDQAEKKHWSDVALRVVLAAFPDDVSDVGKWSWCNRLLPHVSAVLRHADEAQTDPFPRARLLDRVSVYLRHRAQFSAAQVYAETALSLLTETYGPNHPDVATVRNHMGALLRELGDLGNAQSHQEAALEVHTKTTGPDSVEVADDLVELGRTLLERGDLAGAQSTLERALAIHRAVFGNESRAVAADLSALFEVLARSGNLAEALKRLEESAAVYGAIHEPDHPDVASARYVLEYVARLQSESLPSREKLDELIKNSEQAYGDEHPNIGELRLLLGTELLKVRDLDGAAESYARSVAINEASYGPHHPKVGKALMRHFAVCAARGEEHRAHTELERAIKILQAAPGGESADGADFLEAFDEALDDLGAIPAATEEFRSIVDFIERAYGHAGSLVASAQEHLGIELQEGGDLPHARSTLDAALSLFDSHLGQGHARTARCLSHLGAVQREMEDLPAAKASYERALAIHDRSQTSSRVDVMGDLMGLYPILVVLKDKAAPSILKRLSEATRSAVGLAPLIGFAEALRQGGHLQEARQMHQRILEMLEEAYGRQHAAVADGLVRLGACLLALGEVAEARSCYERALAIHEADYGRDHLEAGKDLLGLIPVLLAEGDITAARESFDRALGIFERAYSHGDQRVERLRTSGWLALGDATARIGRGDEARALYENGLAATIEDRAIFLARLGGRAAADSQLDDALDQLGAGIRSHIEAGSTKAYWTVVRESSPAVGPTEDHQTLEKALDLLKEDLNMREGIQSFHPLTAEVPEGWFVKEEMTLLAADGQANIIASSQPLDPSINTDLYANAQGDLLEAEFPGYRVIRFEETEVLGGRRGYIRHFQWAPEEGEPVTQIQLYVVEDGRGYTATATARSAHFHTVEVELRQLLKSIALG